MARVLIVEDSVSQAQIISAIVQSAGHEPLVCKDFSRGIAQTIKPLSPDVVLLDIVLLGPDGKPMADGLQLCREIKRFTKNSLPVIIISSRNDEESEEWALLQGADAFLPKPFQVDDLLKVLTQVLSSSS